jgi:ribosomal protein S18 acetylase RimI-like enzyme
MSARIRLRRATPADLDALAALERACFRAERLDRASFRRRLASPAGLVVVAVSDGSLLGYALARFDLRRALARLDSIAVAARARGRGLGARLLAAVERAARAAGARRLGLEVRPANRAARALYVARGYRPVARLAGYYATGGDALRYERPLAPRRAAGP